MDTFKLQVYDPPMCGCGNDANPELSRFASDLDWLQLHGVEVKRFNLSSNPAAFAEQKDVSKILQEEGNDCLPLIVVNGLIMSKGLYPSRSQLVKFVGIGNENAEPENQGTCGPSCCCCGSGTPSSSSKMKRAVFLIVLLAVGGIFAYKASIKQKDSQNIASKKNIEFTVVKTSSKAVPETKLSTVKPETENVTVREPVKEGKKIGEYLTSLSDLDKIVLNQDAVFIFVPTAKDELADNKIKDAVIAAQRTLKENNVTVGLYTLSPSSPDYFMLSAKVASPAILVAGRGRGMGVVSGEVTEAKLLQAYMASLRGGGCCGSSSSGCN
mgnify:CR=1 FL=1